MEKERTFQIMFIDNDKYVRESLKIFFNNTRLKFLIFKSAHEALNSLKYQDVDVVISDYFLPDMDGIAFLKMVGKGHPAIARVLMATIINDELKMEIQESKIDRFIEKPLTISSLDTIISEFKGELL